MSLKFAWAFATVAFMGAADKPVSFSADIRPVFESSCWKCHGGAIQLSKLDLRTRDAALKGGARGAAIIPGKAEDSRLYRLVAGLEKPSMPMDSKLDRRPDRENQEWINQGAPGTPRPETTPAPPSGTSSFASLEEMTIPGGAQLLGFSKPRNPCRQVSASRIRSTGSLEKTRHDKG
jgi:hypothetical protein